MKVIIGVISNSALTSMGITKSDLVMISAGCYALQTA
jgi:hypothetical protein